MRIPSAKAACMRRNPMGLLPGALACFLLFGGDVRAGTVDLEIENGPIDKLPPVVNEPLIEETFGAGDCTWGKAPAQPHIQIVLNAKLGRDNEILRGLE